MAVAVEVAMTEEEKKVAGRSEKQIRISAAAKTHRMVAVAKWQLTMYRRKMRSRTILIQTTRY